MSDQTLPPPDEPGTPDSMFILRNVVQFSDDAIRDFDPESVHEEIGRTVVSLLPVMRAAIARADKKASQR